MTRVLIILLSILVSYKAGAVAVDTTSGKTAPTKVSGDVQALVDYLCDPMSSDTTKANIIYNWITHNIAYDIKSAKNPDRPTPDALTILKEKKATSEGYSLLFLEMCKAVGLEAVRITGYVKSWYFDNGDNFYMAGNEWCAVMIDRRWELVDPMMGAGQITRAPGWLRAQMNRIGKEKIQYYKKEVFEFKYDPEYFIVNPLLMRYSHLPVDPLWQLCKTPMPLEIFETGDSAVAYFNDENPGRVNRSPELEYMARLEAGLQLKEYADRGYKFNRRYDVLLAMKEQVKANEMLKKHAMRKGLPPRRNYEEANKGMSLAEGYVKKQKGYIPEQYAELKKKNLAKNKEATDYIRKIRTQNKALIAKCRMHATSAERKKKLLGNKLEKVANTLEGISPLRIDSIKTVSIQRDKESPLLITLADSIKAKEARLKKNNFGMIDKIHGLTLLQEENTALFNALIQNQLLSDTLLIFQAEARIHFRDNYDDEVKMYMAAFDDVRFVKRDTMQKRYLKNFDTLTVYYENLIKVYQQQADLYKGALRDMEQYRRQNNKEDFILASYSNAANGYRQTMSQYKETIEVYQKFLEDNIKTFTERADSYEMESDVLDRMDEAEVARKDAEETALNESRTYEERQLDKLLQSINAMQKQFTDILIK